jgi:hypothetical protein
MNDKIIISILILLIIPLGYLISKQISTYINTSSTTKNDITKIPNTQECKASVNKINQVIDISKVLVKQLRSSSDVGDTSEIKKSFLYCIDLLNEAVWLSGYNCNNMIFTSSVIVYNEAYNYWLDNKDNDLVRLEVAEKINKIADKLALY